LPGCPRIAQHRITGKLVELARNPGPPGVEKLAGGTDEYRVRVGNYRIVYAIEDARLIVLVLRIADRKDVYRR
jgi:mRNA interferase RelE/StbE